MRRQPQPVVRGERLSMGTESRLVCVHRAPDLIEANLLRGMLEHDGVPVTLTGENLVGAYSGVPKLSEVRIMVPMRFRDEAAAILRQYLEPAARSDASRDWRCGSCGETNEEQFEVCWQCENPRSGT